MHLNLDFVGRQISIIGMKEIRKIIVRIVEQNLRIISLSKPKATGYHFPHNFLSIVYLIVNGGLEPQA